MKNKLLSNREGLRTFAVVLETGEEPAASLKTFARDHGVTGAYFTAIGALSRVIIGYFDWEKRDYERISLDEQLEVLTLAGNIATKDDEPFLHAHVVLGRADGTALGGHLFEAVVRPTLEIVVSETPAHLRRRIDPATGLALIDLSE